MNKHLNWLVGAALSILTAPAAFAAPPANDDFATATDITSLPFFNSINTLEATSAGDDPPGLCVGRGATVWYKFVPTVISGVQISTAGSNYDTTVDVFKGGTVDSLQGINCSDDVSNSDATSSVEFVASTNVTYYIVVGACCGQAGGPLQLSVKRVPTPPPFDMQVSFAASGTLNAVGDAVISGTVTCTTRGNVGLSLQVTQSVGRQKKVQGNAFRSIDPCEGSTPFTQLVSGANGRFQSGTVGVIASFDGCGSDRCIFGRQEPAVIKLAKK